MLWRNISGFPRPVKTRTGRQSTALEPSLPGDPQTPSGPNSLFLPKTPTYVDTGTPKNNAIGPRMLIEKMTQVLTDRNLLGA